MTNPIYMFTYFLPFVPPFVCVCVCVCASAQSKHNEDISATRPILLDELEVKVCLSLSLFACVLIAMCHHVPRFSLSFSFCIYMYASPLTKHSFLFYFAFFRPSPSPSPSPFITPQ